MELLRSNLYVYAELPTHNGKWIISSALLNTDGCLEVKIQNEEKSTYHLCTNYVIQAPMDTVWNRLPSLPFRRSAKETFSLHVKKGSTTWFLASSEEERNQWYTALISFTNRKPPPYGDYDNWTYSHLDSELENRPVRPFHPRKSLTPTHRSGYYSVQEPRRKNSKFPDISASDSHSGFYSVHEHKKSSRFPDTGVPQHRSGFYSVHEPKKKVSDEPTVALVLPPNDCQLKSEPPSEKACCGWCCVAFACICNLFSACLHHCCMNFAAAV